jgi:hypothetical protein
MDKQAAQDLWDLKVAPARQVLAVNQAHLDPTDKEGSLEHKVLRENEAKLDYQAPLAL